MQAPAIVRKRICKALFPVPFKVRKMRIPEQELIDDDIDEEEEEDEEEGGDTQYTEDDDTAVYFPDPIAPDFGQKLSATLRAQYRLDNEIGEDGKRLNKRGEMLAAVGKRALAMIRAGVEVRLPRDRMIRDSIAAINMIPADRESPLGEDGANIRTPLSWKNRQSLHAYLLEVATGVRPYLTTEGYETETIDATNKIEDLLDAYLTEIVDWYDVQDTSIGRLLDEGTVFLRPCWHRERNVYRDYQLLTQANAESFGFTLPKDTEVGFGVTLRHKESGLTAKVGQFFDGYRNTITKNCPKVDVISYFDYVQYPARHNDSDTATLSGYRFFATFDEMRHGVVNGIYDGRQLNKIENSDSFKPITDFNRSNLVIDPDDMRDPTDEEEYEEGSGAFAEGSVKAKTEDASKDSQRLGEYVEFVMRFDGNGDNLEEDWLFVGETSTETIIRAQPLIGKPGLRPLRPVAIFKKPGRLYGMPLGMILEGIQEESDVSANLALDAGAMNLTLIVEEERQSGGQLAQRDLRVGLNHRVVDEHGKISVHNFPMPTQEAFVSGEKIDKYAEETTAISETLAGGVTEEAKTKGEINAAMMAGTKRLKVMARRLQNINEIVAYMILEDIRRYGVMPSDNGQVPLAINYAVSRAGERIYGKITLEDLYTPVKLFAHGDTINTNQQLMLQGAEKVWMMMERDNVFMGSSFAKRYAAERTVLQSYGVRNVKDLIGTQQEAQARDEEQAKQPPPPTIPGIAPNLNEQFLAVYLAQNPDQAEKVIAVLSQIAQATEAAKGTDNLAVMKQEAALLEQKIKMTEEAERMKTDMAKQKAKHEIDMAGMKLEQTGEQVEAEIGMRTQQAATDLSLQRQQAANESKLEQGQISMKSQQEQQKIQRAKIASQAPAKPKSNNGTRR